MDQKPTVGRIVHYQLAATDADLIRQSEAYLRGNNCNPVAEGQVYPAMVVAVFGNGEHVNLKVLLDGGPGAEYWATSRAEGEDPGRWSWPPRA